MRSIIQDGVWNEHEVRLNFPPVAAEAILNTFLNRTGSEDIRYWKDSKDGKYSVKTGYLSEIKCSAPPPFQSNHPHHDWWKKIWTLNLPPKVRIFLWRASKNFIPSSLNLLAHHVPVDGCCDLCKLSFATTCHVLFFCPNIKVVWKPTVFWIVLKKLRGVDFIELASVISKHFDTEAFELFVVMSWALWTEICKGRHAVKELSSEIKIDWVYSFLSAFRQHGKTLSSRLVSAISVNHCWVPPAPNMLRLDVDAGFDEGRNRFSVGAVIRDNNSRVLGASACIIRHPGSVKDAELCAIRFGMEFCLNLGLYNVNIFSDSILAVQAISSSLVDLGPSGVLSIDILNMLKTDVFLSINHMSRSANRAAHRLAREDSDVASFVVWNSGDIPAWLLSIVNQDISK